MNIRYLTYITLLALSFCSPVKNDLNADETLLSNVFNSLDTVPKPLEHVLNSEQPDSYLHHIKTLKTNYLDLNYSMYVIADSCSSCWHFHVVQVHNDSLSYAIPYWDDYYYWSNAHGHRKKTETDFLQNLSFESDLRELFLKISKSNPTFNPHEVIRSLMYIDDFSLISEFDICSIESFYNRLNSNSYLTTDECNSSLLKSIKELQHRLANYDSNILMFKKGYLIYIFTITNDDKLFELSVLNHECSLDILM